LLVWNAIYFWLVLPHTDIKKYKITPSAFNLQQIIFGFYIFADPEKNELSPLQIMFIIYMNKAA